MKIFDEQRIEQENFFLVNSRDFNRVSCLSKNRESMKVCQNSHLLFYAQSPDFHKLGLCYNLKILYL